MFRLNMLARLVVVTPFLALSVLADETLLVCDGESLDWWDDGVPKSAGFHDELTLAIDGNFVDTAGYSVQFSNKEGTTWVWTYDAGENTWLYNLNTISGTLKRYVSAKGTENPLITVAEWKCRRVERRLIEQVIDEWVVTDEPASSTGMWAVQLGSFGDREHAVKLAADLRKRGFLPFLSKLSTSSGELHRVRIGPQKDRVSAEEMAERLQKAGHKGQVVPHP